MVSIYCGEVNKVNDVTETREYTFSIASEACTPQQGECPARKDVTLHLLDKAVTSGKWTSYSI